MIIDSFILSQDTASESSTQHLKESLLKYFMATLNEIHTTHPSDKEIWNTKMGHDLLISQCYEQNQSYKGPFP